MNNIYELSNGIQVICEEMPYFRSVAFGVWVKVGSSDETVENNGISHLIEHMMFKGTKNRTAKQIADHMSAIGGNLNAFTSKECTSFFAKTLEEHLYDAIDIIGDMITNSVIDEKELEKEKCVVSEEIDMYLDSSEDLVHEILQKNVWINHPLGYVISGEKSVVKGFTRDDIIKFMQEHYVGENIIISLAGRFNSAEVIRVLEEKFGSIKRSSDVKKRTAPVYNRCFCNKFKEIEQAHLDFAFDSITSDSEERYSLAIVNSVLGGSINSRLFQNIREELGLTYSIYSYGNTYKMAGLFQIYAAMNPSQIDTVFHKILEILSSIKRNGINRYEIDKTKDQIKTELIMSSESTQSRMNSNARSLMNKGHITSIDENLYKLNAVTEDDVAAYIDKYFVGSNSSVAIIGNLSDVNIESISNTWRSL